MGRRGKRKSHGPRTRPPKKNPYIHRKGKEKSKKGPAKKSQSGSTPFPINVNKFQTSSGKEEGSPFHEADKKSGKSPGPPKIPGEGGPSPVRGFLVEKEDMDKGLLKITRNGLRGEGGRTTREKKKRH